MGNICSFSISCDALFSHCADFTARKAAYINDLKDNILTLQTELQKLLETRNDVLRRVIIAEQRHMRRTDQVQGWLSRVQTVELEVAELISDSAQEIEKLCLGGFCSKNCQSNYKFGKKVAKYLQVVATLKGEKNFEVVAERRPEPAVEERPIPQTLGLESTFDEVWRCLGEEHVGIIGLYGMGGVGKTTLLTKINNKFFNTPNGFDFVIWVVVSRDLQIERLQENIARKIGLYDESWKNKRLEIKAADIFKILSRKKFVLLLDDIWNRVDLEKLGVPPTSTNGSSKIVFTTRSVGVCGLMEAHRIFKVKCLEHKEAWELFQMKVGGETLESHLQIPELAEIVAKECDGLPLALITIGRAMAFKKTPQEWKDAIQVLRRSASEFPGMDEVYPLLKFSYDNLPNEKIKSCFLYCCLFPEDCDISKMDLIDCWIGEGFFDEYDRGYTRIGDLLRACLLEEVNDNNVKLHDVIRDMALWIASEVEKEKESFIVQAGARLTEAPETGKWQVIRRMSLMENQVQSLSKIPTCPSLITLFLNNNNLKVITDGFFQFMPSLKVLNLSKNQSLKQLPSGISRLVSLQHLNLSWTKIKELPEELKALVNLRSLNLNYTKSLCRIPRQLISNFSMLYILRIINCHYFEEVENCEALIEEVLLMENLNVLGINLTSSHALSKFLSSHRIQSYILHLRLGLLEDSRSLNVLPLASIKNLESLGFRNCEKLEELKIEIGNIQQNVCVSQVHGFQFHSLYYVVVSDCNKLRNLSWLGLAPNLLTIDILRCPEIEEISGQYSGEVPEMMRNLNPFPRLELLILETLPKLKSIYPNALPFLHLKEIKVSNCPELKKLPLDSNSAKGHKIVIRGDESWWEELQWENQATQDVFLPCFRLC